MLFAPLLTPPPIAPAPLAHTGTSSAGRGFGDDADVAALRSLLDALVRTELRAGALPQDFRSRVSAVIDRLILRGLLPDHLAVADADPPALLERTVVAAWRRLAWC